MKTAAADGMGLTPIALTVLEEAMDRYGLLPIGRPLCCGFSCHLITLERAMRHPALAVISSGAQEVFAQSRELGSLKWKANKRHLRK
jgi:hypothetical protein